MVEIAEREALEADALRSLSKRVLDATGALIGMVQQHCDVGHGRVDSKGIAPHADAIRVLEAEGMIVTDRGCGTRVIAHWAANEES